MTVYHLTLATLESSDEVVSELRNVAADLELGLVGEPARILHFSTSVEGFERIRQARSAGTLSGRLGCAVLDVQPGEFLAPEKMESSQAAPQDPRHDAALKKAMTFKRANEIGKARRELATCRTWDKPNDETLRMKLRQQHALCTYKDPDLPVEARLEQALDILESDEERLFDTKDQETLGLAGAIYKRKFELDGQPNHLQRSLAYYLRGHDLGHEKDYGYNGINAAYVLDLLAHVEEREAKAAGGTSATVKQRRDAARKIRSTLRIDLPPLAAREPWLATTWWFLVTVAEAHLGLRENDDAKAWLRTAAGTKVEPWERHSTITQLTTIARFQKQAEDESDPWSALEPLLGEGHGMDTAIRGRVGLALSGGGFRASFFHIGVLARLAELDLLRHVEVLSCVSGGSIVGAHYYLEIKKLLEAKQDLKREDYVAIVARIEKDFLEGVQQNIRTRMLASVRSNIRMIFSRGYSRTQRAGELFEEHLYSKVGLGAPLWMDEMKINPSGNEGDFRPKYDNWSRKDKVPMLVLNAATLNTGHSWHFTATFMGEPPGRISPDIDGNSRLRRMYYGDAPADYKKIRFGHAVAASAAVPGIFPPINLPNLYQGWDVQLVDGGVHDNQGIDALLEHDCQIMLVSDASGQMEHRKDQGGDELGVLLRTNSIFQARLRAAQYMELDARRKSARLKHLMFLHLKKDLGVEPVAWNGCKEPSEVTAGATRDPHLTDYGVNRKLQQLLSGVRTDLDSFTKNEAYALMTSAYYMTKCEAARCLEDVVTAGGDEHPWEFLRLAKHMQAQVPADLLKQLEVGKNVFGKVFLLHRKLMIAAAILGSGISGAGIWWIVKQWDTTLVTVGQVGGVGLGFLLTSLIGARWMRLLRPDRLLRRLVANFGLAVAGWLVFGLHLLLFDRLFLRRGDPDRLEETRRDAR